jgi:cbb3-type cytochrome oxidase subunit 3
MSKIIKYFLILWLLGAMIGVIFYLLKPQNRSILLGIGVVVIGVVFFLFKERLRRKKEGYYVYKRGGAEDGVLVYDEGGKTLNLYFSRRKDTIYVPSDTKWKELMPGWAKEKKALIMHRIKLRIGNRMIGKNWTYEESDNQDYLIKQN